MRFRLHSRTELKLGVINKSARSWPVICLTDSVHELNSTFPIVEQNWIENSNFWQWSDFNYCLSYDSDIALTSHDQVVNVRSTWNSRLWSYLTQQTFGSNYRDVLDDIFNISISIFFHSTSPSTNPSSKCAEFHWIWLVTTADTILFKIAFEILALYTSLNASHIILFINPLNCIHSRHIYC